MKKTIALILALAMALSLAACGGSGKAPAPAETPAAEAPAETPAAEAPAETPAGEPAEEFAEKPTYNFRMSTESKEGQWLSEMLQNYADDVYEATKGQVKIDLYLDNSLGASEDIWSMFTQGTIEMCYAGVAHAGYFPVTDVVQTPFVCGDTYEALAVMKALESEGYLTEFTNYMHVISYMPTLPQEFMMVDKEVKAVEDLSGMVIRGSSAPLVECIENLGSTATSIAIPDLYMALSQGVADATITSVDAAQVFSLQDVVKYLVDMPISFGMNYLAISNQAWNSLPADIQAAMDEVGAKYQELYMELNDQAGEDCLKVMTDGGLTVLEPSDELVAACQEATAAQVQEYIDKLNGEGYDGQAVYDAAMAAIG